MQREPIPFITGTPPEAAQNFIAQAEHAFNAKDLTANCAAYAPEAIVDFWIGDLYECLEGITLITAGWRAIFAALPQLVLKKSIISASSSMIINEWTGSLGGSNQHKAQGVEFWLFNPTGQVIKHRLYTFLRVTHVDNWMGKVSFGLTHPVIAVRLERGLGEIRRMKADMRREHPAQS